MNTNTDPYKLLRAELVQASCTTTTADTRRRGWRARPSLLAASTTALAAVAVAVVLLSGSTAGHAPAGHPGFAFKQAGNGKVTVNFVDQTGPSAAQIAGFNRALAAIGARMGRPAETLVQTSAGLDVRCPDGQTIQTISTSAKQGTKVSWDCSAADPPGQSPASTTGA